MTGFYRNYTIVGKKISGADSLHFEVDLFAEEITFLPPRSLALILCRWLKTCFDEACLTCKVDSLTCKNTV